MHQLLSFGLNITSSLSHHTMRDIPIVLKAHHQLHGLSCAASALESIAKIHEKIDLADPLQNDPASQRGGFQSEVNKLKPMFGLQLN